MLIPPKYVLTSQISKLLQTIEACREVIDSFPIPPEVENNIRRKSILKSSLYSARIEGNTLTPDDITLTPSRDQRKKEVNNLLKAISWVTKRGFRDLTIKSILEMHKIVTGQLADPVNSGKFRTEQGAIFNAAGIAVYLPPPPRQIPTLINKLVKFTNSSKEPFVPIRACLAHYTFEKIHPFLDGNGRVGRLILQAVLTKGGYGMKGLTSVEEYLDKHRSQYYSSFDSSERDTTDYLEFMLTAIAETAESAKDEVLVKRKAEEEDYLLPRRAEIFRIVKEHKLVNFDTIRRRFLTINERTLRYDLKQLADRGLIRKRGTTRGVYYEPVKKED